MAIHVCLTDEEIQKALQNAKIEVSSDTLDQVLEEFDSTYEEPVAVTLENYLDALDALIQEQCGDWSEYIDYFRYMKDLFQNEENLFSLVKINDGYCIVYEDIPEFDDDDDEDVDMEPLEA